MSLLDDIMKALDRFEEWKKLRAVPARTDELERRIAVLEGLLSGKRPGDVCKGCGEKGMRLKGTFGPGTRGLMREEWDCEKCGLHESRQVAPHKS